jgi:putative transposase
MTTASYESLSHAKWDGKYHVVFIPKGRKKALYGKSRSFLGPVWRELAGQRGSTIVEGHRVQDHVHRLIRRSSSTPKEPMSQASSKHVTDDSGSP